MQITVTLGQGCRRLELLFALPLPSQTVTIFVVPLKQAEFAYSPHKQSLCTSPLPPQAEAEFVYSPHKQSLCNPPTSRVCVLPPQAEFVYSPHKQSLCTPHKQSLCTPPTSRVCVLPPQAVTLTCNNRCVSILIGYIKISKLC